MHKVIVQLWRESDYGSPTYPRGYSLHLNEADHLNFIKEWKAENPDIYISNSGSLPWGICYVAFVDSDAFNNLKASKNGTRHMTEYVCPAPADIWDREL